MQLPNFLVIGAQKSGTTWLHQFLLSRPDVYVPACLKELSYFDNRRRYRNLGIEGYSEYFSHVSGEIAIGEVTPNYLWVSSKHAEWGGPEVFRHMVPNRVRAALGGDVKIVAILRNPIERALSAYIHHRKQQRIMIGEPLSKHWTLYGIVHTGFYSAHLARWREAFLRENFFITTYESFFSDSNQRCDLLRFLGADPNAGNYLISKRVYAGTGFTRNKRGAFDRNGRQIATASEIHALRKAYRPDIDQLKDNWSLDLSSWQPEFQ
ncbi:MAG: sulfotransferase domain-containing protein [Gammaproteobacteria bacterium]|nr:sulfotransferase domain-containing protein [Gammaproteobacteria bacterium]